MRTRSAIAALMLVIGVLFGATPAFAHHSPGPCDFHRRDDESTRSLAKRRIVCAVERFGPVPGGQERAICIARRESGLDPSATSPTGQYRGLFQHDRDMWPARFAEYTRPAWELSPRALNGRTNAIVTIRMVFKIGTWRNAGWSPREC
ncbi:MAG: hypothetical protein H0W97_04065 [Actinobacteria bacterium]|nr:hypothetical protein [Actinomycetota bacterium]